MATRNKPTPPPEPVGPVPARLTFTRGRMSLAATAANDPADLAAAEELVKRCGTAAPAVEDLDALGRWLRRDGVMIAAERLADECRWRALSTWGNAMSETAAMEGLRDLRVRLGFGSAPVVERLLIELICTAWLILNSEETELQRVLTRAGGYRFQEAEAVERRLSRAHGRFLRAVESLERVRALQRVAADRTGEATPRERALARAEIERRRLGREGTAPPTPLPEHAGDGAAHPAEAPTLALSV